METELKLSLSSTFSNSNQKILQNERENNSGAKSHDFLTVTLYFHFPVILTSWKKLWWLEKNDARQEHVRRNEFHMLHKSFPTWQLSDSIEFKFYELLTFIPKEKSYITPLLPYIYGNPFFKLVNTNTCIQKMSNMSPRSFPILIQTDGPDSRIWIFNFHEKLNAWTMITSSRWYTYSISYIWFLMIACECEVEL